MEGLSIGLIFDLIRPMTSSINNNNVKSLTNFCIPTPLSATRLSSCICPTIKSCRQEHAGVQEPLYVENSGVECWGQKNSAGRSV